MEVAPVSLCSLLPSPSTKHALDSFHAPGRRPAPEQQKYRDGIDRFGMTPRSSASLMSLLPNTIWCDISCLNSLASICLSLCPSSDVGRLRELWIHQRVDLRLPCRLGWRRLFATRLWRHHLPGQYAPDCTSSSWEQRLCKLDGGRMLVRGWMDRCWLQRLPDRQRVCDWLQCGQSLCKHTLRLSSRRHRFEWPK